MALLLDSSVRTDIITRRRYTLDKRIANRLSALLWANDGRTQQEIANLLGVPILGGTCGLLGDSKSVRKK
jgi:hypothetical protein